MLHGVGRSFLYIVLSMGNVPVVINPPALVLANIHGRKRDYWKPLRIIKSFKIGAIPGRIQTSVSGWGQGSGFLRLTLIPGMRGIKPWQIWNLFMANCLSLLQCKLADMKMENITISNIQGSRLSLKHIFKE